MKSIVYWHPLAYSFFIKLNYWKNNEERYRIISNLLEENSSLVDVCCGDCKIFNYLKEKKINYLGLDFNLSFIEFAKRKGINVAVSNVIDDEIPRADYILMQGSLYQFIPKHNEIIKKMLDAARKYLIICEPIKNKTQAKSKIISSLAIMLSDPGDGVKRFKFNFDTMRDALRPYWQKIEKEILIYNGSVYLAVIKK